MDLVTLTDHVADDLDTNVALPAHRDWRYVRPRSINAQLAPILAVYPTGVEPGVFTTMDVVAEPTSLEIKWAEDAAVGVETGGSQDQERAKNALQNAQKIIDQLYGYHDGVAGDTSLEGDTTSASFTLNGDVWVATFTLEVSEYV